MFRALQNWIAKRIDNRNFKKGRNPKAHQVQVEVKKVTNPNGEQYFQDALNTTQTARHGRVIIFSPQGKMDMELADLKRIGRQVGAWRGNYGTFVLHAT